MHFRLKVSLTRVCARGTKLCRIYRGVIVCLQRHCALTHHCHFGSLRKCSSMCARVRKRFSGKVSIHPSLSRVTASTCVTHKQLHSCPLRSAYKGRLSLLTATASAANAINHQIRSNCFCHCQPRLRPGEIRAQTQHKLLQKIVVLSGPPFGTSTILV